MRVLHTIAGLEVWRSQFSASPIKIGLVPTMGALHSGHLALIHQARQECEQVVVSIFVNPLQFGPQEDLNRYPRTLESDCELCRAAGVDLVFAPTVSEMYPNFPGNLTQVIPPPELTQGLCGASRPGHFAGVATVVLKLFNLVQPQRAYFGQKDAQQVVIIRRLVKDINLPLQIVTVPIVRDAQGLALSSRNQYLNPAQKIIATTISQALHQAQTQFQQGIREAQTLLDPVKTTLATQPEITLDYLDLVDPETLQPLTQIHAQGLLAIAAYVGSTRLIDNCLLDARPPILAIDGPAGAGKSTVTRLAAQGLGLTYLDTGAMYRAVTWWLVQQNIDLSDPIAVAEAVSQCQIRFATSPDAPVQIYVNGENVTQAIRDPQITRLVSQVAAQPAVRRILVKQQQEIGQQGGVAAEGRDIGTHVFPQAGLKIFLTASVAERAKRRWQDLQTQGHHPINLAQLETEIQHRDEQDQNRAYAPFRPAADAVHIVTDDLTIPEVVAAIIQAYRDRFSPSSPLPRLC